MNSLSLNLSLRPRSVSRRRLAFIAWFLVLSAVTGCASTSKRTDVIAPDGPQATSDEISEADHRVEPEPHTEVPVEINSNVQRWIQYFSVKDRARFRRFLESGLTYKPVIQQILRAHGVPEDIYYLAMIESGFVPRATSSASAAGVWQFIRSTGKRYGLESNRDTDERRDVIRATHAAASYLKDLYTEFGSWYLAMAAYNAGEGRVRSAVAKSRSNDFWKLVKKRTLPKETVQYVPKFLAALIIGKDAEKYGFKRLEGTPLPAAQMVEIPSSVALDELASKTSISQSVLHQLNPNLIWGVTPRTSPTYAIWVPKETAGTVVAMGDPYDRYAWNERNDQSIYLVVHKVRTGETLRSIARHYRLSIAQIKRLNGLRSSHLRRGQPLKIRSADA